MTNKCPVCNAMVSVKNENICPQCGGKLKSTFRGMTEEEQALYVRQLAMAIKEGLPRRTSEKRADAADPVQRAGPGAAASIPQESPQQALYSEATSVPVLERDRFEYPEEFKARIEAHPPIVAGSVQLLKEHYDLTLEVFPVKVQWLEWVKPLLKQWLVSTAFLRADRDFARAVYLSGSIHPVYVHLRVEGEKPAVAGAELYLLGQSIRLETGRPKHPSEPVHPVWKEPVTGMDFIWVEAGCYSMGAGDWDDQGYPHERPVHKVCLDGFWMGKYPVAQGEWEKLMGSNPSHFKTGGRYPVECVSWLETRQFIKRLTALNDDIYTFRLPTEAEWEYGCRSGGRPEKYPGGTEESDLEELGWHAGNSESRPREVGAKKPNSLGLYDMSGNVWEWCEDIYSDTAYERHDQTNPVWRMGEPDRVIRGGSWYSNPNGARCSSRGFLDQTYRRHFVGFRLVRTR